MKNLAHTNGERREFREGKTSEVVCVESGRGVPMTVEKGRDQPVA